jgi:hypothetical protein
MCGEMGIEKKISRIAFNHQLKDKVANEIYGGFVL